MDEYQLELASKLTTLQRKFVLELLKPVVPQITQRQAYLAVGGKAKNESAQDSSACEIWNNPKVQEFYNYSITTSTNKAILSRDEALEILTDNAKRCEDKKDQHAAIKQLVSMQGWDAPKKTELTGAEGGAIKITQIERKIV